MNFTSGAIYVSRIQHIQLLTFFKPFFSSICAFPSTNIGKQSTIDFWEYFLLICLKMNMKPLHFANKQRGEFQPNHLQIFVVSHCLFRLKVYRRQCGFLIMMEISIKVLNINWWGYNLFVCYLFVRMLAPLPRRLCSLLNEKV